MTYNKVEELCRYCGGTRETCTAERAGRQGDFAKGLDPDEEHAELEPAEARRAVGWTERTVMQVEYQNEDVDDDFGGED